jgi:hypothetical protein
MWRTQPFLRSAPKLRSKSLDERWFKSGQLAYKIHTMRTKFLSFFQKEGKNVAQVEGHVAGIWLGGNRILSRSSLPSARARIRGSHPIGVERVENVIRRVCCVRAAVFRQRKGISVRVAVADEVFQVAGVIREHGVSPVGVAGRGLGRCRVAVVVVTGTEVWKGGLGCMRSEGRRPCET